MTDPEAVVVQRLREASWLRCAYHFLSCHLVELRSRHSLPRHSLEGDLPIRPHRAPDFLMHGCDLF